MDSSKHDVRPAERDDAPPTGTAAPRTTNARPGEAGARFRAPPPETSTAALRAGGAPLDARAEIARLDRLADLLDSRFRVPILGWRFGLDSVLGLIPGVGDVAALGPSAYLVWQANRLGASRGTIGRMVANTAVDFAVGTVPVAGDVFDAVFKANRRNVELLKRDLASRGATDLPPPVEGGR